MFHERFLKKMIWKSPKLIRRLKDTLGLQQGLIMFMTHSACLHHFPKTNRLKMVTGWSRCSWILSATLTNSTGTEAGEFSNYQLCSWKNGMAHDYIFFKDLSIWNGPRVVKLPSDTLSDLVRLNIGDWKYSKYKLCLCFWTIEYNLALCWLLINRNVTFCARHAWACTGRWGCPKASRLSLITLRRF